MSDHDLGQASPTEPSQPELPPASPGSAPSLTRIAPPTTTEPDPETAPADLVPVPGRRERFAWYLGTMLLSIILITAGLRLDVADLKAPFYYDEDSLLILPLVKANIETGFGGHWRIDRLGAPSGLDLHDFPVIDHLHFFLIWLMSKAVANVVLVYNLYFLLSFPLAAFTAMIAFRELKLTLPAAAVGGLLYTFLPFHYQRWEHHYFLSQYWLIPISLLPVFEILRGHFPFLRRDDDGIYRPRLRSLHALGMIVLGAATASAGAYYAFFTCAILAFAGLHSWVGYRTWRAFGSACALCAVIVFFGVLNHLPQFVYQAKYGKNPVTERYPEAADHYGLKIAHMVLPIEDHNLRFLNEIKWDYNTPNRPSEFENRSASLGIFGSAGFIGFVALTLLPLRRSRILTPFAHLTLFCVLSATIGGFGAVFNLLVTPQIRAQNRISVFIAFFCFFAGLWVIDRFLSTRVSARARRLKYPAWAVVFLLAFLDQTPFSWFKTGIIRTLGEQRDRFNADARFFGDIERTLTKNGEGMPRVFCLPYCQFPETAPVYRMTNYDHIRGYIHTGTVRWSFGAIKGREEDVWQQEVSNLPADEFLRRIVFRGFDGLFIDKHGYATTKEGNRAVTLLANIQHLYASLAGQPTARLPEITHEDREQFFVDLRPYRELLKQKLRPPFDYEAYAKAEQELPTIIWLSGFYTTTNEFGEFLSTRYGTPKGIAWFINPSDRTRTFTVSMRFSTDIPGTFQLKMTGLLADEFELVKKSPLVREFHVEVPPGRHRIQFRCTPPPSYIPTDIRRLCYEVSDIRIREP
jgi:hypothetical protein